MTSRATTHSAVPGAVTLTTRTRRSRRKRAAAVLLLTLAPLAAPVIAAPPASAAPTLGERAVAEAKRHLGKPYKWAAAGPDRFDCSGFTLYVFSRLGKSLPHNSTQQARAVRRVPNAQKRLGDLIFTKRSDGTIRHVGIYAGGSDMWAAVQTGDTVRRQSFHGRTYIVGRVG
jgi:cell wall-associated NlpC family hydrolase